MLYQAYQAQADIMASLRGIAGFALQGFGQLRDCSPTSPTRKPVRNLEAGYELLGRVGLTHERPPWGIDTVRVGRRDVAVHEEATDVQPFGTLLHFAKEAATAAACRPLPKVLLVAPLSGHFATLLRGTVQTLLPEQDVWVTDWHNARDVGLADGSFGFDTLRRVPHPLARGARPRDPRDRGVPAVRRRARRHRGDVRGRQRLRAPHAHADGRVPSTPGSTPPS